ncbi:MAG: hypothetical protein K0S65_1824, partial [Labilithrix sp.]|nr:hypothetical protein [Labilithrix sp.]
MTSRTRVTPRGALLGLAVVTAASATMFAAACADSEKDNQGNPDATVSVPGVDADVEPSDAGGDVADGEVVAPVDCTQTAFCPFTAPIPPMVTLNAIWGTSATDIWAVGTRGTILHGDGTTFRVLPSGTEEIFFSVWASAPDDVWITSGRVPRHSRALDDGGIAWDVTV